MPQPFNASAIILIAALVYGPAFAQSEPAGKVSSQVNVVAPVAGVSIVERPNGITVAAPAEATSQPAAASHDGTPNTSIDAVGQYMHRNAVKPVIIVAQSTGDWVVSSADAFIAATQNAGAWVKSQSDSVAIASQDIYDWLNARAGFVMTAAQDTSDWIVTQSHYVAASAQDATDWLATNTQAAAESVTASLDGISIFGNWSAGLVGKVKKHLEDDKTSEFSKLVAESGYEIANVVVGVGLIPDLVVGFKHDHDLSPEQFEAFRKKVDEYAKTSSGIMGYLETALLRNLVRACDLSEDIQISELDIKLLPLPGLALAFDPYLYEEKHNQILHNADKHLARGEAKLAELENRIKRLEAQLSVLNQ